MPGTIPIQAFYAALLLAAVVVAVTLPAAAWIAGRFRPGVRASGHARPPRLHWRPLSRRYKPVTTSPALADARAARIRIAKEKAPTPQKPRPQLRT